MQSKYHHLIPQTYLSAWGNSSGTLKIEWLENGKIENRNTDSVAGINHYHSIIAGMPFCTKDDTDHFFACLCNYSVTYDGEILSDTLEMNKYYGVFNEWSIKRDDGTAVRKRSLKAEIDSIKIQDIEDNWSAQYENKWPSVRSMIEQTVDAGLSSVPQFEFRYLMEFFTALDWRSILSNSEFVDVLNWICNDIMGLDKIDIPKDERELPMFETATDYMKHCLLLSYYRKFLYGAGVIHTCAEEYMKHMSFHFLVSEGKDNFITSDNPAFIGTRKQGDKVGILPITPKIIMTIGRNSQDDNNYYITKIGASEVREYNRMIRNNSGQFIVYSNAD